MFKQRILIYWRRLIGFLRAYRATKVEQDAEKLAEALGRPLTLELTQAQAEYIAELFQECEPKEVAKRFYTMYPRSGFRYFMVPTEDGMGLTWGRIDYEFEAVELIWAAARVVGALKAKEDGDYWQLSHPMARRFVEFGTKMQAPTPSGKGILG